jgi:flavin reductase (DIM6/NTAB) family NADH-FMN oxidoreductase RutF
MNRALLASHRVKIGRILRQISQDVKMQISTAGLAAPDKRVYKLLYAAVTPRPIAWVSTISEDGTANLAPYSFFNAVCAFPPTLLFSVGYRDDPNPKDTLTNIRATGEFVVNFVSEPTTAAMNITATEVAPGVDEFERAGLTKAASVAIKPPRVAESPIHFECTLNQIVPVAEHPGGAYVIIGNVVHMHVDDSIFDNERGYVDFDAYSVVGRMAGNTYTRTAERFDLIRPPSELR